MTRFVLFLAALTGVLAAGSSRADVEVAPPPREVRTDGSRDPAPISNASQENPAEVVERIIKNSKAVGDKLAMTDTGTETRGTQDKILRDIDALLNQKDNPPPSGGGGESKDKNQDNSKQNQKNDSKDPSGGKSGMEPMGGNQQANSGRKPRAGDKGGHPKDSGKQPSGSKQEPDMGMAKANPTPKQGPMPKDSKTGPAGAVAGASGGKMPAKPALPIDDDVVKEVWGHLPDKLRQQVTQYYKEQFMPRYSDLLKQYYSSLANTPGKSDETRK